MRPTTTLLASLLVLAASCGGGGSDPATQVDAGYSSLSSGDASAALSSFDGALSGMEASDPKFLEAKVGQCQALSHVDPAKARTELLSLAKESGVTAKDYSMVVTEMVSAATSQAATDQKAATATIGEAVAILTQGKQTFPEYDKWDALIRKTGDKAATLGSADALESLKGLGYVGGD